MNVSVTCIWPSFVAIIITSIAACLFLPTPTFAISSITGTDAATSSVGVALPISDIQIVGNAASSTPVKLVVSNGTLGITNTGGLSTLSGTTGSTITFTATVADANAALATLTYTRGGTGTDTLEVSLVGANEVFFPGTGHLYEYIASVGDWNTASTAAQLLTRYGATGYLTTITSQEENDFVAARLTNAGWMGASDAAVEGEWRWVAGPEAGTQFWAGDETGGAVSGRYENWASGEPNDASSNEDCAQFLSGGSGEWNDLPCAGTDLPGYVAEFGAPGDMPTVVAKNISLATIAAPNVDTFVPADNATGVNGANDLVLTFSEAVTVGTGTITIYRTSDDSVVESIPVTDARVTGSGTNTITINPTTTLSDTTAYYVHISATAFENVSNVFFLGITANTVWNFTTGDFTGPTFSAIVATPSADSAVLTWNTNELSSTQVVYGEGSAFNVTTVETNTAPRVTAHTATLSGLDRCTAYSYRLIGVDGTSNGATSTIQTFTTTGCSSGGATRVTTRSFAVTTPSVPNDQPTATGAVLNDLWNAGRLADAAVMISTDQSYISQQPELVVKILQAYVAELQSKQRTLATTSSISEDSLLVRDLYLTMEGEDVRRLQTLLIQRATGPAAAELQRVTATGYFSTYTKNALGEYQRANGIVPYEGYFGAITRAQMKLVGLQGLWW